MKNSSKSAIGGIVAALSLVLMISIAVVPFLTYALPAVAGVLLMFVVIEINKKWAFGVYATVAILGVLFVPDKEVAIMYLAFFGYYPIVKSVIESKLPHVPEWICKILLFNATVAVAYLFMIKIMGLTIDEFDKYGMVAIPMLLGLGTFAFVFYDYALSKLVLIYNMKFRKYFRRFFR